MKRLMTFILVLTLVQSCGRKEKPVNRATLKLGPVASSVWDDGSVALAISIENSGERAVGGVTISSVSLDNTRPSSPATLPVSIGEILPESRSILQIRFASLAVPGSYTLVVSGRYADPGGQQSFTLQVPVAVTRPVKGTDRAVASTTKVQTQRTSGLPTKPSPIVREYDENDRLGSPVPEGQPRNRFPVAPAPTSTVKAGSAMGVTFVRDTATGQSTGVPPDPSTAAASSDGVVLSTANTYLLFSKDDGQTFKQVDPTTIFPQSDGGLCCDQVVLFNRRINLFFWLLQYKSKAVPAGAPAGTQPGPNRLRIAYANPAALKSNVNAWTYFDLTQGTFNSGGGLDYPDLAFTDTYLYASVDGCNSNCSTVGLIVARMPLSDITGGGSIGIGYIGPNETSDQARALAGRLTQGSSDAMYWAGHVDTSSLEIFRWLDNSNGADVHTATINTYCNSDFKTLAPDNQQWLDNLRAAGTGGIIALTRKPSSKGPGEVWIGWTAARDDSTCTQGRPQPYVKIVRINDTTLDSVGEYHIWNKPYAFAYPSLGTAPNGDIGVSVAFGGPKDYGSTTVGYLGDFVVYYVEKSDVTLTFPRKKKDGSPLLDSKGNPVLGTRFGDMFAVRNSGPDNTFLSSLGYSYKFVDSTKSTNCSVAPGCTYRTHYEQWKR